LIDDLFAIVEACKFTMKRWHTSWICRVNNHVHIAWTQTGRHSILSSKKPHWV